MTPTDSITYTITATGPGGSADASVARYRHRSSAAAPPAAHRTHVGGAVQQGSEGRLTLIYDKADIRADARDALSQTAQFLRSYPQFKVVVEGHCDERGSTEYNLALGDRRAQAAKDFLVSLGVPADRMQTVSYGKERPFCTRPRRSVLAAESPRTLRDGQVADGSVTGRTSGRRRSVHGGKGYTIAIRILCLRGAVFGILRE